MTDYCKVRMIGNMISNCLEYTDWSKDNLDALVSCIDAVVNYNDGDYPPLSEGNEGLMLGYPVNDLSRGAVNTSIIKKNTSSAESQVKN